MWRKKSLALSLAGFFLCLDQLLKFCATNVWQEKILLGKLFGWQPFENTGAAFGLPVPGWIVVWLSIIIITLFVFQLAHDNQIKNNLKIFTCLFVIVAGAASNLIDRLLWGHTIDYILIFTGIINIADIMIVVGMAGFVYFSKYLKSKYVF